MQPSTTNYTTLRAAIQKELSAGKLNLAAAFRRQLVVTYWKVRNKL